MKDYINYLKINHKLSEKRLIFMDCGLKNLLNLHLKQRQKSLKMMILKIISIT